MEPDVLFAQIPRITTGHRPWNQEEEPVGKKPHVGAIYTPEVAEVCLNCDKPSSDDCRFNGCDKYQEALAAVRERQRGELKPAKPRRKGSLAASPVTLDGVTKPLADWAEELGINFETIRMRIKKGMAPENALTAPVGKSGPKATKTTKTKEQAPAPAAQTQPEPVRQQPIHDPVTREILLMTKKQAEDAATKLQQVIALIGAVIDRLGE